MDLANTETLRDKIARLLTHHNALLRGFGKDEIKPETLYEELTSVADKVLPFMDIVWRLLDEKRKEGKAHPVRGRAGRTAGHRPRHLSVRDLLQHGCGGRVGRFGHRAGRARLRLEHHQAYTTRVGEGPFPTELTDEVGQFLGEKGHEFGVVTGRKRAVRLVRCGAGQADRATCGINGIALTKLDVLDGLKEIKNLRRLQARRRGDRLFAGLPGRAARVEPIYETLDGWEETTREPGAGPICRRRRSSMSATSRN